MNYNQREIVLLPFPFSDLSSYKKRPALIISNNEFNQTHEDVICCLLTTNLEIDPHSIVIEPNELIEGKLPFKSKIKPYRLFSAQQKIIYKKFGVLNTEKYTHVIEKLTKIIK